MIYTVWLLLVWYVTCFSKSNAICKKLPQSHGIQADHGHIIYCNGFDIIPDFRNYTEEYDTLLLKGNLFTNISSDAFKGLRIKRLILQSNPLSWISKYAFRGLTTLRELVLETTASNVSFPSVALQNLTGLSVLEVFNFKQEHIADPSVFQNLKLVRLKLKRVGITYISKDVFKAQPFLTALDLSDNKLQSLPSSVLQELENLEVFKADNNNIKEIAVDAMHRNAKLKELSLRQNKIKSLEQGSFNGIEQSLLNLDLSNNPLNHSQLLRLHNLTALKELKLTYNALTLIPKVTFTKMHLLQYLNMDGNLLTSLEPGVFNGLSNLKTLYISNNYLNTIKSGVFNSTSNLQNLHLQMQYSTNLEIESFHGIETSLMLLYLQKNKFLSKEKLWKALGDLHRIEVLDLSNCMLDVIPPFAFENCKHLKSLSLFKNNILTLQQEMFHGLQASLQFVELQMNPLRTIDSCVFWHFKWNMTLANINLKLPSLQCDCRLAWLYDWMKQYRKVNANNLFKNQNWKCIYPQKYKDRYFSNLTLSDLTCINQYTEPVCKNFSNRIPSTTVLSSTKASSTSAVHSGGWTTQSISQTILPAINITLNISDAHTMIISWHVTYPQLITEFYMSYQALKENAKKQSILLHKSHRSYTLRNLANVEYLVCIQAVLKNLDKYLEICKTSSSKTDKTSNNGGKQGNNTWMIAGIIIGILLILAIVPILIFICRKSYADSEGNYVHNKPDNSKPWPSQIKHDSKQFSKPRKNNQERAKDLNISVIYNGKTEPDSTRLSAGSYPYLADPNTTPMATSVPIPIPHYINSSMERSKTSQNNNLEYLSPVSKDNSFCDISFDKQNSWGIEV